MNAHRDGPPAAGLSLASLAIPVTVIAVAALLATAAGSGRPGHGRAVGFAATVCLTGAVAGWMVTVRPALTPMGRVTASLASLSLRLFPALMALGWLQAGGTDLRAAGAADLRDQQVHVQPAALRPALRSSSPQQVDLYHEVNNR